MRNKYISIAVLALLLGATAFKVTIANETNTEVPVIATEEVKSVAYYVANTKEARDKNKECYEQKLDMQTNLNCAYSLHALQISYVGGERISGYKYAGR